MPSEPYWRAQQELDTYYGGAESILGLHAAGLEPGSEAVWDAARCNALHERMLRKSFGNTFCPCADLGRVCTHGELRRLAEISATVARLEERHRNAAMVTFTARRWPDRLAAELGRGERGGSLVGLALGGQTLREEHRRRFRREGTPLDLLLFAVHEAEYRGNDGEPQRVEKFFRPVRVAAERELAEVFREYDLLMRDRRLRGVEAARVAALS